MSNIVQIGNKYYDFGTKNTSFIQTAKELKTLGRKNWMFMLEVKHPELGVQDINPHDENLTPQQQGSIIIECSENIWFYFREVLRVPARGAPQPLPFYLHRGACAMIWCYWHNISFMACQVRQTYKTTTAIGLISYGFLFDLKNCRIPMMHILEKKAVNNAKELREYILNLPKYMNPFAEMKKPPGTDSITYAKHQVNVQVMTAADSQVTAEDKLRGDTIFIGLLDEWEFTPFIDSVISGAAPAINSGREITKLSGRGRNCLIMISTPGNLETTTGKAAQRMIDQTQRWTEEYYDMSENEINGSFFIEEQDGTKTIVNMVYMEYFHYQLRKGPEYLEENFKEFSRTGQLAEYRRGCLLQRFRGSGSAIFDQADIDFIASHVRQPDYDIFIMKKYHLYVYKHQIYNIDLTSDTPYFDTKLPYLIGIDIASGGGGDNTTFCIVNPYTLEICAELESPYLGANDLVRIVLYLMKLIPSGIFCPETNAGGKDLIDTVQERGLESRFYHDPQLDLTKNVVQKTDTPEIVMQKRANNKKYIGVYVNQKIREQMFSLLISTVTDYRDLVNSQFLVRDIQNLVKKNNKIQADDGEHDDMVMAYNHVLYVLHFGHDLARFGINKELCTYDKARQAVRDHVEEENKNAINNMISYGGNTYEDILRDELTTHGPINPQTFSNGGYDEYGYTYDDYSQDGPHVANSPYTGYGGMQQRQQQQPYEFIPAYVLKEFEDMN